MRPALYRRGPATSIAVEARERFYASLPRVFRTSGVSTLWGRLRDAGLSADARFAITAAVKRHVGRL